MTKPSDMLVGPQALFGVFSFTGLVFMLRALHPIKEEQSGEKMKGGNQRLEDNGMK